MPKFDWYAATIRDDPAAVIAELSHGLGGEVVESQARNGYARGHQIIVKDSAVATIFSGGQNGSPHAFASSDDSPAFAELVRRLWPVKRLPDGTAVAGHYVTRMDAAIDFDGPGTWDRLAQVCLGLADERRIMVKHHGDWHRLEAGRTLTFGSPKSAVTLNLYEKGKELRGKALDGGADISPDLVRFEVRVRPEKDARWRAAEGLPVDAFGYSDWSKELLRLVTGIEDIERVHIKERRESDHERAMFWLIRQYGEHLEREAENVGGWGSLGQSLLRRLEQFREQRPEDAAPDHKPYRDKPADGEIGGYDGTPF